MDVESLTDQLSEAKVDPNALGQHPRFSNYKNATRAAERQVNRRKEALERQRERREDMLSQLRKLADEDEASDDETAFSEPAASKEVAVDLSVRKNTNRQPTGRQRNRHADQLMTSEWLVDIPEELSSEWIMVPAPIGKRVLVVASKFLTSAYTKGGRLLHQFKSSLPSKTDCFTILDCILKGTTFYCIDMLAWNGTVFTENPFDFRRFWLNNKLSEDPQLSTGSSKCKFKFVKLPECACEKGHMEKLISQSFDFEIDGFLFYYRHVLYEAGQSPLVGWLKPFMLQELLGIQVPQKFLDSNEEKLTSHEFIDQFNKKHKHSSKIAKDSEMAE